MTTKDTTTETPDIETTVENKFADIEATVSAALKQGAELIRKHPVESAIAGFGLGCLVGALLLRRN